jgi:hypothetical protein
MAHDDACANLGKHRVVCGFSGVLRVIDHEAVLMDPKLFSVLKLGPLVSGVVETGVRALDGRQAAGGASREKVIG